MKKNFLFFALVAAMLMGVMSFKGQDSPNDEVIAENPATETVLDMAKFQKAISSVKATMTKVVFDAKQNQDVSGMTACEFVDNNSIYRVYKAGTVIYVLSEDNSDVVLPADLTDMFNQCANLQTVEFNRINAENVTRMIHMFSFSGITSVDFSNFNTPNLNSMNSMFRCCSKLVTIKGFDKMNTSKVTNMIMMFHNCSSLVTLDLSGFSAESLRSTDYMFWGCKNLVTIYATPSFSAADIESGMEMFYQNDKLVGGLGSTNLGTGNNFAHIDEEGNPGLFTAKSEK